MSVDMVNALGRSGVAMGYEEVLGENNRPSSVFEITTRRQNIYVPGKARLLAGSDGIGQFPTDHQLFSASAQH